MKSPNWVVIRKDVTRFVLVGVGWTIFFIVMATLNRFFGLTSLIRSVKLETWLGLGATILTTIAGRFAAIEKHRQEQGLIAQQHNQKIIEENNHETVLAIKELEDGLDGLVIQLNTINSLEIQQSKTWELLSDVKIQLTDLNQRQIQGDRLDTVIKQVMDLRASIEVFAKENSQCQALEMLAELTQDMNRIKKGIDGV